MPVAQFPIKPADESTILASADIKFATPIAGPFAPATVLRNGKTAMQH
jgi:hypothetical protein